MWFTPPFEGPDEGHHMAYVLWLADGQGLPPQGEAAWNTPIAQEAAQPPFYYLLAAIPARLVGNDPSTVYRPNPHFPSPAPGAVQDNKNVALHYPEDTRPLQGGWLALYLARGVSLLFGLLLIVCIYGLVQTVLESLPAALMAALLVATTPQVIFHSSLVSNDMAAAAMSTFTLWLLARLLRQGASIPLALAVGAVFGLALLSKVSTLVLGPALALGLIWLWVSGRSPTRTIVIGGLCLGISTILVAGWWYGRAWLLYGSPLGLDTHCYAPWAYCDQPRWTELFRRWHWVFDSYWVALGWGNIKFPDGVYALLLGLVLLAGMGLVRGFGRWWRQGRPLTTTSIFMGLLVITLLGQLVAHEVWMHQVGSAYGRLLFPSIGAITILLIFGWQSLHPRMGFSLVIVLPILALLVPGQLLGPAYLPPRPLTDAQIAALGEPVGWRFGEIAELIRVTPGERSVPAGGVLPVEVCWRTLARADRNYTLFIRLIGPGNSIVAGRFTYPGLGSYPTEAWQPNRVFCDVIRIDIPTDLPQPLVYPLEIGWLDDMTDERLPAIDTAGNPVSAAFISAVRLAPNIPPDSISPPPGDAAIRLAASDFPATWQAGHSYPVTLQWWMAQPVTGDYTVFVHLRDGNNQLIAQADGPPLDNWYPTSWWTAEEPVNDTHSFPLPPDVPSGTYTLFVGLYDPLTGERLGGEYKLGTVKVEQ